MTNGWLTPSEWSALMLSLRVAGASTLVTLAPGVACAWLLSRGRFPLKGLFSAIIYLPLVLPPVVVGYALLALLGRGSAVGGWLHEVLGLDLAFTWQGAAIASGVMGFPLLVRASRLAIDLVDRRLEQAASTLGATPWRIFFTITLPLALPGVLAGMVLAFARALGEFGATITFAGNIEGVTRTLPSAVFTATQIPGGDAAAMRLVIISLVISLASIIAAEALAQRATRRRGNATPC